MYKRVDPTYLTGEPILTKAIPFWSGFSASDQKSVHKYFFYIVLMQTFLTNGREGYDEKFN